MKPARRQGPKPGPLAPLARLLVPPTCLLCKAPMPDSAALCHQCFPQIRWLHAPLCHQCGLPFDFPMPEGSLCGDCSSTLKPYDVARALMRYEEASRILITRMKYGDQGWIAARVAPLLGEAIEALPHPVDLILPVPLHRSRIRKRLYNQSALLARHLSRYRSTPWRGDLIHRTRPTPSQAGLNRKQRERNMRGAFQLSPLANATMERRAILLIDDVMTTGATIEACCRTLQKAHPAHIQVLTIARRVLSD